MTLTLRHRILDTIVLATGHQDNNSDRGWGHDVVPSERRVPTLRHLEGLEFCQRRAPHKYATTHRVPRRGRAHDDASEYHSLLRLSLSMPLQRLKVSTIEFRMIDHGILAVRMSIN